MLFLLYLLIFILIYTYFLYPLTLYLIALISKNGGDNIREREINKITKSISLIIPVYNEESIISDKLENINNLEYPRDKLEIHFLSDNSTDNTNKIISDYIKKHTDTNIKFKISKMRKGKTNLINIAMENNTSEIVVFTDANVILDKKSLKEINRIFSSDEKIGCVEGNLFYINSENLSAFSSGYYWTYEQFIKTYESKTGSMMGADGSIFAIRKKIFKTLPLYVLDDFSTSMNSIFMGYRLIKSSSILAYEKTSTSSRDEFNRKIRISNRSYNTYRYLKNSIWSMDIFNRYKFFFHKYIRWHSFTIMILIYLSNLYLIFNCKCMNIYFLFIIQNIFYLFALLGFLASEKKPSNIFMKIISFCYYFFSANLASFIGIFKSYLGSKIQFWETIKSGR